MGRSPAVRRDSSALEFARIERLAAVNCRCAYTLRRTGEVMRTRLRYVAVGLLSTGLLSIGSALAWADDGR